MGWDQTRLRDQADSTELPKSIVNLVQDSSKYKLGVNIQGQSCSVLLSLFPLITCQTSLSLSLDNIPHKAISCTQISPLFRNEVYGVGNLEADILGR